MKEISSLPVTCFLPERVNKDSCNCHKQNAKREKKPIINQMPHSESLCNFVIDHKTSTTISFILISKAVSVIFV